ncbi:hypothetical protein BRADI_2g07275v3 [Brachypodium distachyon]|uniref:Uncharacterized protein n=1 Tax=Brachypodium distachyon TaxID=15368 RepID=A0A2K2D7C9_BRADI|nr:hypothetical protein BRADI_2g07275v3 [Brachypodium distachyon]
MGADLPHATPLCRGLADLPPRAFRDEQQRQWPQSIALP